MALEEKVPCKSFWSCTKSQYTKKVALEKYQEWHYTGKEHLESATGVVSREMALEEYQESGTIENYQDMQLPCKCTKRVVLEISTKTYASALEKY